MAIDISTLLGKTENEGSTDAGRLTAKEWNTLVQAVEENQKAVAGTMKGIIYKGGEEAGGQTFNQINERGYLIMNPADPQGTLTVFMDKKPNSYIASGAPCEVEFHVTSRKDSGGEQVISEIPCSVRYYIGTSDGNYTLVGSDTIYDYEYSVVSQSQKVCKFDFAKVTNVPLGTGDTENWLKIEISNGMGRTNIETMIVRVIDMSVRVENFDINNVFVTSPYLTVTVYGTDANVYAQVDDTMILNGSPVSNGATTPFGSEIFTNVNTHGVHTIKIWASVSKDVGIEGEPLVISTDPLVYTYIYGTTNTKPVVMATIANHTPEEYTMLNVSYTAYKYSSTAVAETGEVYVTIYENLGTDEDGDPIKGRQLTQVSQSVTFDAHTKSGTGNASISLFPVMVTDADGNSTQVSLVGNRIVGIKIGDYEYIDTITIKSSTIRLSEVTNYAVKLTSSGRNNLEPLTSDDPNRVLRNQWISKDGKDVEGKNLVVDVTFDSNVEFIDTGSGWCYDGNITDENDPNDKGNVAMHLRKGRYFTLNYTPFDTNPTWNDQKDNYGTGLGLTISMEFATRNCLNQNTPVITCMDYTNSNGIGFHVTANKATLYSNQSNVFADFREDTRIRLDMVIEGRRTAYSYTTTWTEDGGKGETKDKTATESEAYAIIYVDGVYQGLVWLDEGTTFYQRVPQKIRFGSEDCDLDVYNIRIYNQALTMDQIVQNYAFDTPNLKEKLEIAKRNNDVLTTKVGLGNKPDINIAGLRAARPNLPFFYVEMDVEQQEEILPKDKNFWKLMKMTQYKNPANLDDLGKGDTSFEIAYAAMKNQGTSSMSYPWPWRNWDWKSKDSDLYIVGDGKFHMPTIDNPIQKESKWPQFQGMGNVGNIKKITLKKDYASSEMCNNAITSRYFTDMALAIGTARPNVMSPAQRQLGAKATGFKLALIATPCFMFQTFSDPSKQGSAGKGVEAMGMMNLIPNKNECDYLGFGDVSGFTWKSCRAQSWELKDNYNDWFWRQTINGFRIDETNSSGFTNDVKKLYEARYPKDSTVDFGGSEADFGMVPDNFSNPTANQAQDIYNEQSDIVALHNWLVSVNRQLPLNYKEEHGDFEPLTGVQMSVEWNIDKKTGDYIDKFDTPRYRLNKFKAEADDHLIVDQFCLYYIWREMFWAYDSGLKNLQLYTMGKHPDRPDNACMQWGCMVRDADTTMGIQNQGRIEFPAHLEDIDYMIEYEEETPYGKTKRKEFHYGALTNISEMEGYWDSDKIGQIFGGDEVLHGQLSCLWTNIRDAYGSKINEIYDLLSGNAVAADWTSGRAIKKFRDHQEKWCESLYNFGMRQYIGGEPFRKWLGSGLGDKKNSRAAWIEKKFYYMDSKYKCLQDFTAVRASGYATNDLDGAHTIDSSLAVKVYMPMYLGLNANSQSNKSCQKSIRITDIDSPTMIPIDERGFGFPAEYTGAVNWFYGTSQITELGDLARVCKIAEFQDVNFPKLRELNLGHERERTMINGIPCEPQEYTEISIVNGVRKDIPFNNSRLKSISFSTMKQLQVLDVTNHTALGNLDLSSCSQLREFYGRGCSSVQAITLPATTSITTLYFPNTITRINLDGLSGITKFVLESPTVLSDGTKLDYNIDRLYINNCGTYMASRSYDIFKAVITSLEKKYEPGVTRNLCTLNGIDWDITDEDGYKDVERLLNIGATLSGKIKIKALPNDLKVRLVNTYGNIDDPKHTLYIEYTPTEIKKVKLPSKFYVYQPGETQLSFSVEPTSANTYKSATWELSDNQYATMSAEKNGVIVRNETPCTNTNDSANLTLTVYQLPKKDGSEREPIVVTSKVYFYERTARPGDIVFQDGSYSDEYDKLDTTKTPIGVCFYVDPEDKTRRLMMGLEDLNIDYSNTFWGLGSGGTYSGYDPAEYWGSSQEIRLDGQSAYNINKIAEISLIGHSVADDYQTGYYPVYFNDDIYRDVRNASNDYFKFFDIDTIFGNIGWDAAGSDIEIYDITTPEGAKSIKLNKNTEVPYGYYNTLAAIEHRNAILTAYRDDEDIFTIPAPIGKKTELSVLNDSIKKADYASYEDRLAGVRGDGTKIRTYGGTLYYPAVSACFAYEPTVDGIHDKFKRYHWFLPSSGELLRMLYYVYQSQKNGNASETPVDSIYNGVDYPSTANAFYYAIKEGILSVRNIYSDTLWSSSENGDRTAIAISAARGKWETTNKATTYRVRPICMF